MKSISEMIKEASMRMDSRGIYAFALLYGYIETHPDVADEIVKNQKELYKKWDSDRESQIEFKSGKDLSTAIDTIASDFG